MPDERAIVAIGRIERALARIEAAAARAPAPAEASASDEELEELRRRHQALKERVQGAIAQIDQLLASRGEGAGHGDH